MLQVGMRVVVKDNKASSGFPAGTEGVIDKISGKNYYLKVEGSGSHYYNVSSELMPVISSEPVVEKFIIIPSLYMSSVNEVLKPAKEFLSEKSAMSHIKKHTLDYEGYVLCKIVPLVKIESEVDIEAKL